MNKTYRQNQILKLIREKPVHTQHELAAALQSRNIPATQVTLSRDIRELGLVKTPNGYAQVGSEAPALAPDVESVVREMLLEIRQAQNLLVLRTPPAHANALASALDHADWPEIVGTIAGDDTVLVVAPDPNTARALQGKFEELLK